jgi:hypothetical protein
MVVDLAFLDHKKGRVRLLPVRDVHSRKNRGGWGSGSMGGASSSLQNSEEEISPLGQ